MANAFDELMPDEVEALLADAGTPFTLSYESEAEYDAEEGTASSAGTESVTVNGSPLESAARYLAPSSALQASTVTHIAGNGLSFTPAPGMKLTDPVDSRVYKVVGVDTLRSGVRVAAYRIFLAA